MMTRVDVPRVLQVSEIGTCPFFDLDPLRHITADRSNEKDNRHRSQPITKL